MSRTRTIFAILLLIGALPVLAETNAAPVEPFTVTITHRVPATGAAPVYDPALPGYRVSAEIGTLTIHPRGDKLPEKFVLAFRAATQTPMLEGFTLKSGAKTIQAGLKLNTEEVVQPNAPVKLEKAGTYFQIQVVGREIRVIFQPAALALLQADCVISWVDWYRN